MILLALLLAAAPAHACALVLEQRLEAPFTVYGAAAASVGDTVVLAGGSGRRGAVGDAWALGPDLSWRPLEAGLTWRRFLRAGVLGGEVLLADGYGTGRQGADNPVTTVEGLALGEPPTRRVVAQAPVERYFGGAAVYQGELWLAGGHDLGGAFHARVDVLDPATGQWRAGPRLSQARDTALVVVAGRLYAFGGYVGRGLAASTQVERLDREGAAWEPRAPMPAPTSAYAAAAVGEDVFFFGDYTELGRVLRYDSHDDRWSAVQADYTPRRHAAATTVGDRIVVVGGNVASSGSWLATTEIFRVECAE